ncbi:hypothetical protein EV126DRAFT_457917 [Verticillium dahliae]|nr:hypothetical protein EV126DRAFT_457917 [Verticillium dahliae]
MDEHKFAVECSSRSGDDGDDDDDKGEDSAFVTDSEADESERWDDNSEYDSEYENQVDRSRHCVETLERRQEPQLRKALEEVLELLFQLSVTICTGQYANGEPSSTLLVYFSGVLGLDPEATGFRRGYAVHLHTGLKNTALEKFKKEADLCWMSPDLLRAAEVYTSTMAKDRSIRDIVAETLSKHPSLLDGEGAQNPSDV